MVEEDIVELGESGLDDEDFAWMMKPPLQGLNFAVTRESWRKILVNWFGSLTARSKVTDLVSIWWGIDHISAFQGQKYMVA